MNQSIASGTVPPVPGLEKEEPELADEEDIPSDDDRAAGDDMQVQPPDGAPRE